MASGWRGAATGALALVALEVVVQPAASGRLGDLFGLPATWAARFLDPAVPTFTAKAAASSTAAPGESYSTSPHSTAGSTPVHTTIDGKPVTIQTPPAGAGGADLLPHLLKDQPYYGTTITQN